MPALADVSTWIFDLDNTLYPASASLGGQISRRMSEFVGDLLELPLDEAERVRKQLFRDHGTTLRGLMTVHGIDPADFLAYVHDIDLSELDPAVALDRALTALPGRKLIHTNASAGHAERILARLGLAGHFDGVFDIVAAEFRPKPDRAGYAALIRRHAVEPGRAAMVEDMARNLRPAAELGMATVWVRNPIDWASEGADEAWVHHATDDLAAWLGSAVPPCGAKR